MTDFEDISVLVVDDEPSNIATYVNLLAEMGLKKRVYSAPNGKIALELAMRYNPELIITDWQMPEFNGLDLTKSIKENSNLASTQIIMITAVMTEPERLKEAFDVGIHDFLKKPFDDLEFFARVRNVLNLIESEKSKDRLFSIVAHDLRGSVGITSNILEIILKRNLDKIEQEDRELLDGAFVNAKKTNLLLENLLTWASSQLNVISFSPSQVNLLSLVEQTSGLYEAKINNKEIELQINIPEETMIYVDAEMLKTIFRNLISNALKYTPQNGKIEINSKEKAEHILIEIKDSGVGISQDRLPSVFDINNTESTRGVNGEKGTGLGLSIVKDFVRRNNGTIWVESIENKGTVFSISFPGSNSAT